jgi:nucleoside-diphosphate-sugar epimerase
MRVLVTGHEGYLGSVLVPRLVAAGHEVVAVSRGQREPYAGDPAWRHVQRVVADRDAEDAAGTFAGRLADLRPDAVVDGRAAAPGSTTPSAPPTTATTTRTTIPVGGLLGPRTTSTTGPTSPPTTATASTTTTTGRVLVPVP